MSLISVSRLLLCLACIAFVLPSAAEEGLPRLIAHRGASANAPENTLAAIRLAWEEGADGIEADFFLSKDGEVVCIHDDTTQRTAGTNIPVKESTLAQLRALEYGAWKHPHFKGEKIPVLSEVLDELPPGKWFFLEIKDTPLIVKPIAEILARKRPDNQKLVLISFSKDVVKACRETMPEYRSCLISSLEDFPQKQDDYLAELEWSGSQGLLFKHSAPATREWLAQARGTGGILMAWTVDERGAAIRSTRLGAEFIGTNRPAALRAMLEPSDPSKP